MFFRELKEDIKVSLTIPQYADEIFALTESNRSYLGQWLPWLDSVKEIGDTMKFIESEFLKLQKGKALHETIFYRNKIVGVLGFNKIDNQNGVGVIGYWLGEEFTGQGITTLAVKDLIELGFKYFSLQKMEIHCATKNKKSRAIPERLGFKNEGIIRRAELVAGEYHDHVVYGLLKQEFITLQPAGYLSA